jgi:hypothetical protein
MFWHNKSARTACLLSKSQQQDIERLKSNFCLNDLAEHLNDSSLEWRVCFPRGIQIVFVESRWACKFLKSFSSFLPSPIFQRFILHSIWRNDKRIDQCWIATGELSREGSSDREKRHEKVFLCLFFPRCHVPTAFYRFLMVQISSRCSFYRFIERFQSWFSFNYVCGKMRVEFLKMCVVARLQVTAFPTKPVAWSYSLRGSRALIVGHCATSQSSFIWPLNGHRGRQRWRISEEASTWWARNHESISTSFSTQS